VADRVLLGGLFGPTSAGRLLGSAAALLGRREEARAYFGAAFESCTRSQCRPELALTHLELAELLLTGEADEPAEGMKHLDLAIDELRAMKMAPALERALRHKGLLHA
jgi:hypothetical protein